MSEPDLDDDVEQRETTGPVGVPINTQLALHDMRLRNGQKTFAELRGDISNLEATVSAIKNELKPKPVNWTTLVFGGIGILTAILGALWTLSIYFSDRPTRSEIKEYVIETRAAQERQGTEITTIRDQQTAQRVLLDNLRDETKDTGKKIDLLLQHNLAAPATGSRAR